MPEAMEQVSLKFQPEGADNTPMGEHILRLRHVLLASLISLSMNTPVTPTYGPELPTPEQIAQLEAELRTELYGLEREAELWEGIVDKFADELSLVGERSLAERIAKAVENSSQEFDVDPWLILSLIRVESAGKPDAVSYVGARGLTQIMPATGEQIAKGLGVEWTDSEMLFDVETNIRFGTYYVRQLLDRFEDVSTALAAYNWGPAHIAGRIKRGKALPVEYPGKVMSRYQASNVLGSS